MISDKHFQCENGFFIQAHKVCNGYPDCLETQADETNCKLDNFVDASKQLVRLILLEHTIDLLVSYNHSQFVTIWQTFHLRLMLGFCKFVSKCPGGYQLGTNVKQMWDECDLVLVLYSSTRMSCIFKK